MDALEITSIIASIVSVIIGGFAIWLSITFYKMSNKTSEDIKSSASQISSSISIIQALFDRMYSDIFSIAKDTFSDYRQRTWKLESSGKSEELVEQEKVKEIKDESSREIERILKHQAVTDDKIDKLARDLGTVINKAIDKSANLERESQKEDLRKNILSAINDIHRNNEKATMPAVMIALGLNPKRTYKGGDIEYLFIHELFKMRREGILNWKSKKENEIKHDSDISVVAKGPVSV